MFVNIFPESCQLFVMTNISVMKGIASHTVFLTQLLTSVLGSADRRGCRLFWPQITPLPSSGTCRGSCWFTDAGLTSACVIFWDISSTRTSPSPWCTSGTVSSAASQLRWENCNEAFKHIWSFFLCLCWINYACQLSGLVLWWGHGGWPQDHWSKCVSFWLCRSHKACQECLLSNLGTDLVHFVPNRLKVKEMCSLCLEGRVVSRRNNLSVPCWRTVFTTRDNTVCQTFSWYTSTDRLTCVEFSKVEEAEPSAIRHNYALCQADTFSAFKVSFKTFS